MDNVSFWRGQKVKEDKGGTFNVELYLAYLQAINVDCREKANTSNVMVVTVSANK